MKIKPIRSIEMKIRLSSTILLLLIQISLKLRPRPPRKTNTTKKTIKEIIQLLELTPLRLQKKIKTRLKT